MHGTNHRFQIQGSRHKRNNDAMTSKRKLQTLTQEVPGTARVQCSPMRGGRSYDEHPATCNERRYDDGKVVGIYFDGQLVKRHVIKVSSLYTV